MTELSYDELMRQIDALKTKADEARTREMSDALARVHAIINQYKLSPDEVFPPTKGVRAGSGEKVPAKYRDPASGKTWTGRGKPPLWIKDKDRAQFAI